ncbi:flagellar biosynthetic protein FliO [Massilia sp. H-1]|nr:flagellar biosynthetic protein FliO [Massilia sp. H-1]
MTGLRALVLGAALVCGPACAAGPDAAASVPAASVPAASAAALAAPAASAPDTPALRTAPALPSSDAADGGRVCLSNLVQTITGLLLVLGALALFAWAMKRFGPKAQAGAGGLRIVGGLNLGGRERIVLVEVGDQWIVVGASPGRVNALHTLPRQDTVLSPAGLADSGVLKPPALPPG